MGTTETAAGVATLRNYIDGHWVEAQTDSALDDRDPASGELLARVPLSGAADVDSAVRSARQARSFDGDLHANGRDAFEFYTRKKVVTSRW